MEIETSMQWVATTSIANASDVTPDEKTILIGSDLRC